MSVFDEAKNRLSMEDVVKSYGFEPDRSNFIRCPFHNGGSERTASMRIFGDHYHCFSCGAHGSVIDFTAGIFGIEPLEAVRKLNADFNLGLALDRPATAKETAAAREREALSRTFRDFESWRLSTLLSLNQALYTAHSALKRPLEEWDKREELAVRYRPLLEYWADTLESKDAGQQMMVFRGRKEAMKICNQILVPMPTKSATA